MLTFLNVKQFGPERGKEAQNWTKYKSDIHFGFFIAIQIQIYTNM